MLQAVAHMSVWPTCVCCGKTVIKQGTLVNSGEAEGQQQQQQQQGGMQRRKETVMLWLLTDANIPVPCFS